MSSDTNHLQWRQLNATQITPDLVEKWQELEARIENSDPFLTSEWLLPWLEESPRDNKLLVGLRDDRLILIMPLRKKFVQMQLGGFIDSEQQDLALVCPGENSSALIEAMMSHIQPHIIRLDAMLENRDLPLMDYCRKSNWASISNHGKQSPYVEITSTWEEYFQARTKKVRDTYIKRSRKIEEKLKMQSILVTTPTEVTEWLPSLVRLEQGTWKSATGIFNSANVELTSKRLLALAAANKLRLFLLMADHQLVAYNVTLLHGNKIWYFNTAYSMEHKKVSPGIYQMVEMIKHCFNHEYLTVEMLGTRPRYKREWTPLYRQRTTAYLFAPGISKTVGPLVLRFYRFTKRTLRRSHKQ